MIGYFKVVDKNTKEVLQYFKHASVNDVQKKALRANPEIALICACNDKELELKVSSDLRIYPAEQLVGHLHESRCPKYIHFVPDKLWTKQHTETNIYYNVASHDASAKDYFEKINSLTHYRLTHPENRMPDNYKDFNKRAFATMKYIKTPNGEIIHDISVTTNRNVKEFPPFKEKFVYGELVGITKTNFSEDVYYVDILDCFDIRHRFYIDKNILTSMQKPGAHDGKSRYIGGGFVYKKKMQSSIMSFSDFYVAKIDKLGLIEGLKGE